MTISNPDFESKIVRGQSDNAGKFAAKDHSAPELTLDPRADLDAVNSRYRENSDKLFTEIGSYLRYGMPSPAHRVVFGEFSEGDYMCVEAVYDEAGEQLNTEDDFDSWAQIDDALSYFGDPDDNRDVRDLLSTDGGRTYEWTREVDYDPAVEEASRARIEALIEERRALSSESQAAAISAIGRMVPAGTTVRLGWSDQGAWLSVETVILADGTEYGWEEGPEDILWEDLDLTASDIRDETDPKLRGADEHGDLFDIIP